MRLLQAVADGRLGGGTTHVLQLIETIPEDLPIEVHLVTQAGSPVVEEARRRGAVVHELDFFASRLDLRLWLRLGRLVERSQPDLIHAHGARAGLPMTRAAGQIPMFYSPRGYHFLHKPPGLRQLAIAAERRCSARADLTLFVAEHDRALAERCGILRHCRRHRVILNSLQLDVLPPARGSGDGRQLGFLGRLCEQKSPLVLLDILDRLRGQGYRLTVIGGGEMMAEMTQRAAALDLADRVTFLGNLPRPAALTALAGVDAMLLPSRWEGLPHAPIEAMAIGVPVVANAVGGVAEVIEHGRTGLLVEGLEAEKYVEAVRRLDSEPELRARIVAEGRAEARRRFSWASNRCAYLDLYRETLARAG
jgi:glycosyltransferase involved in cell wall biosynthesis